jgi:hypothetical protein
MGQQSIQNEKEASLHFHRRNKGSAADERENIEN